MNNSPRLNIPARATRIALLTDPDDVTEASFPPVTCVHSNKEAKHRLVPHAPRASKKFVRSFSMSVMVCVCVETAWLQVL
eukprot:1449-Heterococcus_DN1.PRE.2